MSEPTVSKPAKPQSNCGHCGKVFAPKPSTLGMFCSRDCHYEFQRQRNFAASAQPCSVCGALYARSPARRGEFCSRKCMGIARAKPELKICPDCGGKKRSVAARCRRCDSRSKVLRQPEPCQQCGTAVQLSPAQWAASSRRFGAFCSQPCFGAFVAGPKNPAYIHGLTPGQYRATWKTSRKAALQRDGHACILCSATEQLEVHHIDGTKDNDVLTNLATLCVLCHRRVHFGTGDETLVLALAG